MPEVTWYFDFISPYAYLGLHALERLPTGANLSYEPVLLAGLLSHWGQKGPAEIAPKRVWTYRECMWQARRSNVPFRMPAAHPFNSLPYLRLAIAAGNSHSAIAAIFRHLWTTGADPADSSALAALAESLDVDPQRLADTAVKNSLREGTERAVRRGIFGVPSFYIDEHVFWGSDAVDFAAAYIIDPSVLATEEIERADALPIGVQRSGAGAKNMAALSYCSVGSNRLEEAKAFYDALLGSAGIARMFEHPSGGRVYGRARNLCFAVLGPFDGKPATVGNGAMFAFSFDTREEVDAFHAKALALGGTNEGAPGERAPKYYFSYFRDLDGNKLCAYCTG